MLNTHLHVIYIYIYMCVCAYLHILYVYVYMAPPASQGAGEILPESLAVRVVLSCLSIYRSISISISISI